MQEQFEGQRPEGLVKIVADSGSTKTAWKVYKSGLLMKSVETIGFNPYFLNDRVALDILEREFGEVSDQVSKISFYGAGCGRTAGKIIIKEIFSKVFKNADFLIDTDLLGAAKASLGDESGFVCILGTGSVAGLYDGKKIFKTFGGLGYLLGDEGSGMALGRRLFKAYLEGSMPAHISNLFRQTYDKDGTSMLDELYGADRPNRYLASFARFAYANKSDDWIKAQLEKHFSDFFNSVIFSQIDFTLIDRAAFVGSIAYFFQAFIDGYFSSETDLIFVEKPISSLLD
ncbi:hypothetical protein [Aureibacter tunicatorum]|uniref:N-acetylglucosamine kinase-like BadF-type ATPase n=1 Tax=Aureibacter tunicatorum TaxID=866807 RepID=A0AAE3XKR6_9BACT|nr:hypothetical protein [Aureibacter tunicatorum]MDR6237803.1 N-acetylglucosamine kinase-like BadF-type ATPase [Aureibacter tunicatorum]BDD02838.1 hypothetical protein AUTU_03210 [Aureibacter tunicatorum]